MAELDIPKIKELFVVLGNEMRIKIIDFCSKEELNITQISKKIKLNYNSTSRYNKSIKYS
jgi:predicted transcriptional regulator